MGEVWKAYDTNLDRDVAIQVRVRVSIQLISARADETLWADRYDRELEDVLVLQSELAKTVAREIKAKLGG